MTVQKGESINIFVGVTNVLQWLTLTIILVIQVREEERGRREISIYIYMYMYTHCFNRLAGSLLNVMGLES